MKEAHSNNSHSAPVHELKNLYHDRGDGTSTKIEIDAENESITISHVDNEDGADIDDAGSINEKLEDADGHDVKLREIGICVQGSRKLMIVKCSEPYDPA